MNDISELSELSNLSNSSSLNFKTNSHHFGGRLFEKSESESDIFHNYDGSKPKTNISNRIIEQNNFFLDKNHISSEKHEEISSEGFTVSSVKITKQDQDYVESNRRKVVTDRFRESSSDISIYDSFVLNEKTE